MIVTLSGYLLSESCIGVLWILDICVFTPKDMGHFSFDFQGYGVFVPDFLAFKRYQGNKYGDIARNI